MKTLPADAVAYKRTPLFTFDTIPGGLLHRHHTKAGVWGRICMERGSLEYVIADCESHRLAPGLHGIIEPEVPHHVRPAADAAFFIEFYRQPETN